MEQFKEWAESTLRISKLRDQPTHIKRRVYNIYKQDIFDRIYEEIESKWDKILQDNFNEAVDNPYYQQFVDIKDFKLGDPWDCCSYNYDPFYSSTSSEKNRWKYEVVVPEIDMNEVLKNKTYRGNVWGTK